MSRHLFVIILLAMTACGGATNEASDASEATSKSGQPDLIQLMKQLDQNMAQVDAALFRNDLRGGATAANAIATHPRVSNSERQRIQATLGDDFLSFVQGDQRTHANAAALAAAAESEDLDSVLRELDTLTRSCVSCHEDFRARLRPGSL